VASPCYYRDYRRVHILEELGPWLRLKIVSSRTPEGVHKHSSELFDTEMAGALQLLSLDRFHIAVSAFVLISSIAAQVSSAVALAIPLLSFGMNINKETFHEHTY
jgi:hypothetical protein